MNRLEIVYADRRDNRIIVLGGGAWETMAEQEERFAELPAVEASDLIVDFYDAAGNITKDKYIAPASAEAVLGARLTELIRRGRIREAALARSMRRRIAKRRAARG